MPDVPFRAVRTYSNPRWGWIAMEGNVLFYLINFSLWRQFFEFGTAKSHKDLEAASARGQGLEYLCMEMEKLVSADDRKMAKTLNVEI